MILSLGITPKSYFSLAASTDADAQAFITAAGITDATQKSAVNQLVLDLKSANIWTKMKAIYPIVGGTASSHKWNLKDPRDLDAAFRLTFSTGYTHSSNGITPNGAAYSNTFLIPSSVLTNHNIHLSYYSRTSAGAVGGAEIGGCSSGGSLQYSMSLYSTYNANKKNFCAGDAGTYALFSTNSNTAGFQIGSRTANNNAKMYWNGSLLTTNTNTYSGSLTPVSMILTAFNLNGAIAEYSLKQVAFASIGYGLTDTEAANFYTAVQTYQTTLGRQV
jgi:hypothetical protein